MKYFRYFGIAYFQPIYNLLSKIAKPEQQVEERQGRAKTRRSLVDWAWENVDGKTENFARERRSLSRERGIQRDVGEIVAEVSFAICLIDVLIEACDQLAVEFVSKIS